MRRKFAGRGFHRQEARASRQCDVQDRSGRRSEPEAYEAPSDGGSVPQPSDSYSHGFVLETLRFGDTLSAAPPPRPQRRPATRHDRGDPRRPRAGVGRAAATRSGSCTTLCRRGAVRAQLKSRSCPGSGNLFRDVPSASRLFISMIRTTSEQRSSNPRETRGCRCPPRRASSIRSYARKRGVLQCSEANSRASFGTILDDGPGGPIATPSSSACRRRAGR